MLSDLSGGGIRARQYEREQAGLDEDLLTTSQPVPFSPRFLPFLAHPPVFGSSLGARYFFRRLHLSGQKGSALDVWY